MRQFFDIFQRVSKLYSFLSFDYENENDIENNSTITIPVHKSLIIIIDINKN